MRVTHPAQAVNGIPPENVFLVSDSANMPVAEGFIVATYQPYLFPERPLNIYMNTKSKGPGRDMLLGALLARAQQLRLQTPHLHSRVFAQVAAQDMAMMSFYLDCGFLLDDALDVVEIFLPNAKPSAPMGYHMAAVPLSTDAERAAFLYRMNSYRMDIIQPQLLARYMSMQHFTALYISRGTDIVGEMILMGEGGAAKLIGLYVAPNYRRIGIAKCLIAAGMQQFAGRGVQHFESDIIRRSVEQGRLGQSCKAKFLRTACFFPGINYD